MTTAVVINNIQMKYYEKFKLDENKKPEQTERTCHTTNIIRLYKMPTLNFF
jgi:hypothetical protein